MKKFIIGLCIGIFITVFSYNIVPMLYSQLSSSDSQSLRDIALELRNIRNTLESIDRKLEYK